MDLDWWCGEVEARYGMKRHTAITWLVKQYHDKLSTKSFCAEFGNATVDSIARRLGQKAKQKKDVLSVYRRENYEPILKTMNPFLKNIQTQISSSSPSSC